MITRKIEQHRGFTDSMLEIVVNSKLKENNKLYYHCCACGVVYDDPNHTKPLIDVLMLTGKYHLPKAFDKHTVTSGYCNPCYVKIIMEPSRLERVLNNAEK